jgi:hypothetical protein
VNIIDSFRRRGLLRELCKELFVKAAAHLERRIEIGTLENVYKPVILDLIENASYNDPDLYTTSSRNIAETITYLGHKGGSLRNLISYTTRRGAAIDAHDLDSNSNVWQAGTNALVAATLGHKTKTTIKGLTNKYVAGSTENLGRAREAKLPQIHVNKRPLDEASSEIDLWTVLDLDKGKRQPEWMEGSDTTEFGKLVEAFDSGNGTGALWNEALERLVQREEVADVGKMERSERDKPQLQ